MDEAVVIAMLRNAEEAQAAASRLGRSGLDRATIAVVRRSADWPEDAGISLVRERPSAAVEGFFVATFYAAIDAERRESSLIEATLRHVAVPRRCALAYGEAIAHGAVLLALRTHGTEIDRACRALEAAGLHAPTVHHSPDHHSPKSRSLKS